MIRPPASDEGLVESIQAAMDEEIALLDLRRSQLASLCQAIVDRDDQAMERILDQVERAQQLQDACDGKLGGLRGELAAALGRPDDQVRLGDLIALLDEPLRGELAERRRRLVDLAEQFQLQHMRTVMLLTEFARINRLLLEAILPQGRAVTTYGQGGASPWQPDAGLVDAER